jgi:uncharacterized membrane protein YhiD involved in acid resistance
MYLGESQFFKTSSQDVRNAKFFIVAFHLHMCIVVALFVRGHLFIRRAKQSSHESKAKRNCSKEKSQQRKIAAKRKGRKVKAKSKAKQSKKEKEKERKKKKKEKKKH